MASASRAVRIAVLATVVLLLLPAAAWAASQGGHIELQSGATLAQQFGYAPDYRQHVVTFDAGNVPSIRSRGAGEDDTSFVQRLEDGVWVRHDLLEALRAAYPDFAGTVHAGGYGTDRVDWDVDGRAYTVLTIRLDDDGQFRNVLMASTDGCQTWQVLELPFGNDTPQTDPHDWGNVTSEHDSGRLLEGPPLLAVWKQLGPWKGEWASLNQLQVIKPRWDGNMLTLQTPVTVSTLALPLLQCSGGASFAVSHSGKSYFVYSTVVPRKTGWTPTFAATYDEATNTVGASTMVARSCPANDLHCTPGICLDSAGTLHVVTGAHGRPFKYVHSTVPLSTTSWTRQVNVLDSGYRTKTSDADGLGKQTYLSMVIGPDDVLHVVSRQVRRNADSHFVGHLWDALVHQSLAPGQTTWSRPDLIVVPPLAGYSQYYQKLTVDRLGRLFVSCSYFSRRDPPATRSFQRFHHRMVLVSLDGGHAWRFATTADFLAGIPLAQAAAAGPASGGP
jgi:BNR repeat-containing family member